jgi:purine-nucleoside phosphorylase
MQDLYAQIQSASTAIRQHTDIVPRVGIILGSGLGALADEMEQASVLPYDQIPGFETPSVGGHRGELALGILAGQPAMVMRGRFHFYEGYTMQQVTFPVRVMQALGCTVLIVTNAAGGLHDEWHVGDIMRIQDQIFLPGLTGHNPLRGPNDERLGLRFPAMLHCYDGDLARVADYVALEQHVMLRHGVYAMVSGPSFESAAELRMLQIIGADAVGMSTAPEVVVARHAGMKVLGLSLITNLAVPGGEPANHAEVMAAGEIARPRFAALLRGVLASLPPTP